MYRLRLTTGISAAHRLIDYPGICRNIHGHNWKITMVVAAQEVNKLGMAIDLTDLQKVLDSVVQPFDHQTINDFEPFDQISPTSENLAGYFFHKIENLLPEHVRLVEVTVQESDEFSVSYYCN